LSFCFNLSSTYLIFLFEEFLENKRKEPQTAATFDKISLSIEQLINCEAICEHKLNATYQRDAYNFQRKNKDFLRNKVLIDLDFKQKIIIGLSPVQVNSEFYNLENRTLLGKLFNKSNLLLIFILY